MLLLEDEVSVIVSSKDRVCGISLSIVFSCKDKVSWGNVS